jgi:hypothetical protein
MQRAPCAALLDLPPAMEQPMPCYAQARRLLPEEYAIWEQLHRALGSLLACLRRAPQTWRADATYHADLATRLVQVGTALQEAGLENAPFEWETAAVSEDYAQQLLRMGTEATGAWVGRLLTRCAEGPGFFELVRGHVARFAERLLEATQPNEASAQELPAPEPYCDLGRILEEVQSQRRLAHEQARRRADAERRREEAEAHREQVHRLFSAALASAAKLDADPSQQQERKLLAEQLVGIGQGIESDGLGKILDGLPNRRTPWTAPFLPLRFAVTLLQLGRKDRGKEIVACLEQLENHRELRPYYQWFDGLADALWGFRRDVLGFCIPAKLPLPTEPCTWQDRQAAGQALVWIDPTVTSAVPEPEHQAANAGPTAVAALPLMVFQPDAGGGPSQEALPDCDSAITDGPGASFPDGQEQADDDFDGDQRARPRRPDGPEAPHWLWWNDERIRIGIGRSQRSWGLLQYFWRRNSASFEDLCGPDKPWLDSVSDSAIATAVNRFNNDMPSGFPWTLATKNRCVYRRSRQNPAA